MRTSPESNRCSSSGMYVLDKFNLLVMIGVLLDQQRDHRTRGCTF